MTHDERNGTVAEDELAGGPAEHIASIGRALAAMGGMATTISTRQRVDATEGAVVRRLLPSLADRYGLEAECDFVGDVLTVTFTRRGR